MASYITFSGWNSHRTYFCPIFSHLVRYRAAAMCHLPVDLWTIPVTPIATQCQAIGRLHRLTNTLPTPSYIQYPYRLCHQPHHHINCRLTTSSIKSHKLLPNQSLTQTIAISRYHPYITSWTTPALCQALRTRLGNHLRSVCKHHSGSPQRQVSISSPTLITICASSELPRTITANPQRPFPELTLSFLLTIR